MNPIKISIIAILIILAVVFTYAGIIIWFIWPLEQYSIVTAGALGDSFGLLTSFFSGLAFAGVLLTLYIQGKELSLQREELARSIAVQKRTARLSASIALLEHYKSNIRITADTQNKLGGAMSPEQRASFDAQLEINVEKREEMIAEIKSLLESET